MRTNAQVTRFALLLIVAVVLANLVGSRYKFRMDLTSDGRYTLSEATRTLLKELPGAATVTCYFSDGLPAQLEGTKNDFKDLLVEYTELSRGRIRFEFKDPTANDAIAKEADAAGVNAQSVQVMEKDKASLMRAYMGAVVKMGQQTAVIPIVKPGSGMEWTLSSTLKKVSVVEKPLVGYMQGHGEPSRESIPQAFAGIDVLQSMSHFAFFDSLPIHERYKSLLAIDPKDSFPSSHLYWLQDFLERGHGVVLCFGAVRSQLGASPVAEAGRSALLTWLAGLGIRIQPQVITDASCGQVNMIQQGAYGPVQIPMSFPYFPIIRSFADHPVTGGLEAVVMNFCAPIEYTGDTTMKWTPLMTTSAKSNALPLPVLIDPQKQWTDLDFPHKGYVVAGALEGSFKPGSKPARLVVFTSGDLAVNPMGAGQQLMQANADNVNVVVNAVEWVNDNTGLVELRNRSITSRPLKEVSDGERTFFKWVNLALPMLVVVAGGLWRAQWRRRQRIRRMEPGHVQ